MGEYDAFTAGVEYGGLRSRQEIKLLICFLLENLESPMTKAQMNELIQEQGLANYFEVSQAIDELFAAGKINIKKDDGEQLLCATQSVRAATRLLESELPRAVREKALNAAIAMQIRAKRLRENTIDVEKTENGYMVTFTMGEKDDVLMRLSVYVADIKQVEVIKQGFLDDPVALYSGILASLTA